MSPTKEPLAPMRQSRIFAWVFIALGGVLFLAAGNYVAVAHQFGFFATIELCSGVAFIAAGIAQLLPPERKRLTMVLRIIAGALYLGSGWIYLTSPHGTNPGEKCTDELGKCINPSLARQCQEGVIEEVPCRGPRGCFKSGALAMTCDVSVAREEERCMTQNEGKSGCSEDHRLMLLCKGHRFERAHECSGPRGCFVANETQLACDTAAPAAE